MRVLVTGGRNYADLPTAYAELNRLEGVTLVIEGGASGADKLAREWAASKGIASATFHAHWRTFGPAAGPKRNEWMLDLGKPDLVLAFPGGAGTKGMVTIARHAGVKVVQVTEDR